MSWTLQTNEICFLTNKMIGRENSALDQVYRRKRKRKEKKERIRTGLCTKMCKLLHQHCAQENLNWQTIKSTIQRSHNVLKREAIANKYLRQVIRVGGRLIRVLYRLMPIFRQFGRDTYEANITLFCCS